LDDGDFRRRLLKIGRLAVPKGANRKACRTRQAAGGLSPYTTLLRAEPAPTVAPQQAAGTCSHAAGIQVPAAPTSKQPPIPSLLKVEQHAACYRAHHDTPHTAARVRQFGFNVLRVPKSCPLRPTETIIYSPISVHIIRLIAYINHCNCPCLEIYQFFNNRKYTVTCQLFFHCWT
jgi:hypothetical protein